jgi:KDO2-lipid IV(A) lauroyltransferase
MKALKDGHHVVMMVDQKLNTGIEAPFFGRGAYTGTAVARMAAKFGCPVYPVRTERTSSFQFKVTVEQPLTFTDKSEEGILAALTQINKHLEGWIKARPSQWLWMHKRWPN